MPAPTSIFGGLFAQSARPMLLGMLAVPVTVIAPDGTSRTIKAIVTGLDDHQVAGDAGVSQDKHGFAQISLDPSEGIESPTTQHELVYNGVTYNVVNVKPEHGMATLELFHRDMQELSRDARGDY